MQLVYLCRFFVYFQSVGVPRIHVDIAGLVAVASALDNLEIRQRLVYVAVVYVVKIGVVVLYTCADIL